MAMTTTETLGFLEGLVQYLVVNQGALAAKGLTVTNWITELETQRDLAVAKNTQQEGLKAQLRTLTQETETALTTVYNNGSTKLDAIIGVLGKTTEEGKQAARLRSDIRRDPADPPVVPPTPNP